MDSSFPDSSGDRSIIPPSVFIGTDFGGERNGKQVFLFMLFDDEFWKFKAAFELAGWHVLAVCGSIQKTDGFVQESDLFVTTNRNGIKLASEMRADMKVALIDDSDNVDELPIPPTWVIKRPIDWANPLAFLDT